MYESDFAAAQAFLLAAKGFWTTSIYPELRAKYDELTDEDSGSRSAEEAINEVRNDVTYHYFAWLERHLQRMKYSSRYGVVPYHTERWEALAAKGGFEIEDSFSPVLHEVMELPKYYTGMDVHQHQGGLWSDITAGFAYEYGARTTTPLLGETHETLHTRFTELVTGGTAPSRILDLGCGFGKSTRPFVGLSPETRVEAVDLSRPCLYVAAQFARQSNTRNVRYSQQDARHTNFPDESFDLVTSTMLLHEMPVKSVTQLFEECYRVLQPGGRMAHLDFYILPDEFDKFMHYGHSKRNNEVFMVGLAEMDLPQSLEDVGFTDVKIEQFKESADADLEENSAWRFPWTVISAVKAQ